MSSLLLIRLITGCLALQGGVGTTPVGDKPPSAPVIVVDVELCDDIITQFVVTESPRRVPRELRRTFRPLRNDDLLLNARQSTDAGLPGGIANFEIVARCRRVITAVATVTIDPGDALEILEKQPDGTLAPVASATWTDVPVGANGKLALGQLVLRRVTDGPITNSIVVDISDTDITRGCCDPCDGNPDPCCGSGDPCCGTNDPCCDDPDPCCGVDCDDGTNCTDDECVDGACHHDWRCDEPSEDRCIIRYCEEATGNCDQKSRCDDGNECTTDNCNPVTGGCTNTWICPEPSDPCLERVCVDGVCEEHPKCDDDNECTTDSCDPNTGECTNAWPPGCEEPEDPCLQLSCVEGACVVTVRDCDDDDGCTADWCDSVHGCLHEYICADDNGCTEDLCFQDKCVHEWKCDDHNDCTTDACIDGSCQHDPIFGCCDDGDPCTIDIQNPDGSCKYQALCEDNDPCTRDLCWEGNCFFPPKCDDGDPCTSDWCDESGGCHYDLICPPPGDPCLVRNCSGGGCNYYPRDCDDGNDCTTDSCVDGDCVNTWICPPPVEACEERVCVNGVCEYHPKDCDDDNRCTADSCDPETGECNNVWNCPEPEDLCLERRCENGECVYRPKDCDDEDPCTIDICNPDTGMCEHPDLCDDDDPCTDDVCIQGICFHEWACSDDDPCTEDYCLEDGSCEYEPIDCDDGDPCTVDTCDPDTGICENEPLECPECTDVCVEGECPPINVSIGVCTPNVCATADPFMCPGEDLWLVANVNPLGGTFSWQRTEGAAAEIVGPTDQAIVTIRAVQSSFAWEDTEFEVTYTLPSGAVCKKTQAVTVGKVDGGVIVSVIRPVNPGPRPAGIVGRLYPGGFPGPLGPSDQQIAIDLGLSVPGGLGSAMAAAISAILVGQGILPPGTVFVATPNFTLAGMTAADQEWITKLLLSYSSNPRPPTELLPGFVIPTDEHRMVNELKFCYWAQNGTFLRYRQLVNRQIVGDTPFTIPVGFDIIYVWVWNALLNVYVPIPLPAAFPVSYTLTGNLITTTCTSFTGGQGQNFARNALTVRAGPALATYEFAILGFNADDFFSRVKFNVEDDFITPRWIFGHSPTFIWPSHYVYRWQDNLDKYTPGFEWLQTGTRGPFPGFISTGAVPGDPPPGPVPSPWYPCTDPP